MKAKGKPGRPKGSVKKKEEVSLVQQTQSFDLPLISYKPPKKQKKLTTEKKMKFLEICYATKVNITTACNAVGIWRDRY